MQGVSIYFEVSQQILWAPSIAIDLYLILLVNLSQQEPQLLEKPATKAYN